MDGGAGGLWLRRPLEWEHVPSVIREAHNRQILQHTHIVAPPQGAAVVWREPADETGPLGQLAVSAPRHDDEQPLAAPELEQRSDG